MQRITTREPDDSQMEVAIASLKAAMPEEFPAEETAKSTEEHPELAESPEAEAGNGKGGKNPFSPADPTAT